MQSGYIINLMLMTITVINVRVGQHQKVLTIVCSKK